MKKINYSDYLDAINRKEIAFEKIKRKLSYYSRNYDAWASVPTVYQLVRSVSSPAIDISGVGSTQSIHKTDPVVNAIAKQQEIIQMIKNVSKLPQYEKELIEHIYKNKMSIKTFSYGDETTNARKLDSAYEYLAILDGEIEFTIYDRITILRYEIEFNEYHEYDVIKRTVIDKCLVHFMSEGTKNPEVKEVMGKLPVKERSILEKRIRLQINKEPLSGSSSEFNTLRRAIVGFAVLDPEIEIDREVAIALLMNIKHEQRKKSARTFLAGLGIEI